MVKKINQEKKSKEYTLNFKRAIENHKLTLKSAKKWFEQNINKPEEEIKVSLLDKNSLVISIDNSINFPKKKILSLTKKFLQVKKAKYYSVFPSSKNEFSVVPVK